LYKRATQAVFGEGPARARIMLVGEQPGDAEDVEGRPFVGPAGKLLHAALDEVGLATDDVYVTNAVKHFKWTPRGKKRLHAKPSAREASACRPWLSAEIAAVRPAVIVCLGATASQSLLGSQFRLTAHRGEWIDSTWGRVLCTYHPSAVLRAPDSAARAEMRAALEADLKLAKQALRRTKAR
jgi:DNA polymerase